MVSPCVLCLTSGYQIETSELSGLGISACSLPPPPLSFSLSLSLLSRLYTAIKSLRNTACVTSTSACLRSAPVGFDSSSPLAPKTAAGRSVPSCIFQRGDSSGSSIVQLPFIVRMYMSPFLSHLGTRRLKQGSPFVVPGPHLVLEASAPLPPSPPASGVKI